MILNRFRKRSPNLHLADRIVAGMCALFMRPSRLVRSAIVLKPTTLSRLHRALTKRQYRRLFSSTVPKKRGPKGPSQEVIAAIVDMKQRNPTWGCPRIAQQIALAFGIPLNKDVVQRILAVRYPGSTLPAGAGDTSCTWRRAVTARQRSAGRGEPRELKLHRVDLCQVAAGVVVAASLAASEPEPAARVCVAGPAPTQVDDRREVLPLLQRGGGDAAAPDGAGDRAI